MHPLLGSLFFAAIGTFLVGMSLSLVLEPLVARRLRRSDPALWEALGAPWGLLLEPLPRYFERLLRPGPHPGWLPLDDPRLQGWAQAQPADERWLRIFRWARRIGFGGWFVSLAIMVVVVLTVFVF